MPRLGLLIVCVAALSGLPGAANPAGPHQARSAIHDLGTLGGSVREAGDSIAYASVPSSTGDEGDPDAVGDLFVVRLDGSSRHRLTRTAKDETDPAWSPDGRRIAFRRGDPLFNAGAFAGPVFPASIFVSDSDGGSGRRLTNFPKPLYGSVMWVDSSPTWSPDGQQVAFTRFDYYEQEPPGIYVVDAAGGNLRLVAPIAAGSVDGSPNGRLLAFVGRPPWVGILDLNGKVVTKFRLAGSSEIAWSPDGRRLAVAGPQGISIITARGAITTMIRTAYPVTGVSWAPNGRRVVIATLRTKNGPSGIYVSPTTERGRPTEIASTRPDGYAPDWNPR